MVEKLPESILSVALFRHKKIFSACRRFFKPLYQPILLSRRTFKLKSFSKSKTVMHQNDANGVEKSVFTFLACALEFA